MPSLSIPYIYIRLSRVKGRSGVCLAGRGKCQTESRVSLLRQRVRRRGFPREGGWIFAVEGSRFRCFPRAIPPLVCSANIRRRLQTAKRIVPNYHAFNISNPSFFHQIPPLRCNAISPPLPYPTNPTTSPTPRAFRASPPFSCPPSCTPASPRLFHNF